MSIDIGRLATDRAYWDSVAPEGATHWDTMVGVFCNTDGWWNDELFYRDKFQEEWGTDRYTPRPVEPAASEWDGTGLPPVGVECECLFNDGWVKVLVLSVNGDEAWVRRPRGSHIVSEGLGNEFRPLRTPEQREQEALALSIQNAMECVTRRRLHDEDSFAMANILTVAGYRKADDK